jgi:hypothetical protein
MQSSGQASGVNLGKSSFSVAWNNDGRRSAGKRVSNNSRYFVSTLACLLFFIFRGTSRIVVLFDFVKVIHDDAVHNDSACIASAIACVAMQNLWG